jgi:mutator protein MutT
MPELRDSTLVFLIKRDQTEISQICLAMKKRGFGEGRWNGVGGKVDARETIEQAAKREALEEIGVELKQYQKAAELAFSFPHNPDWDQLVHVYLCEDWAGEPVETEEMRPQWYDAAGLPFGQMWPDDPYWLPDVLKGKKVKAEFVFGEGDVIIEKKIRTMICLI